LQHYLPVSSIKVYGEGNATEITSTSGTLQMLADVEPEDATDKTVSWSITRGEEYATINKTGLLTASNNGVVTVRATANNGSGVFGEADISILIVKPKATAVTILHGGQDVTGRPWASTWPQKIRPLPSLQR
jgi:uncharacterized protein YjdB